MLKMDDVKNIAYKNESGELFNIVRLSNYELSDGSTTQLVEYKYMYGARYGVMELSQFNTKFKSDYKLIDTVDVLS